MTTLQIIFQGKKLEELRGTMLSIFASFIINALVFPVLSDGTNMLVAYIIHGYYNVVLNVINK